MKKYILLVGVCFACIYLRSQTIDQVISSHIIAIGGETNIDKANSLVMNGRANVQGISLDIHIYKVQGKLCRQVFKYMGVSNYDIINAGMESWAYTPSIDTALPTKKTSEELQSVQDDLNTADRLCNYRRKKNKLVLAGKEQIDGKDCFKIHVTDSVGHQSICYVDTKSFLINQISENNVKDGKDVWEDFSFADYKPINGLLFPFELHSKIGKIVFNEINTEQFDASVTWKLIDSKLYNIAFPSDMILDTSGTAGTDLIMYTYQDNPLDSFTENIIVYIGEIDTSDEKTDLLSYTRKSLAPLKSFNRNFEIQTDTIINSGPDAYHKWIYSGVNEQNKFIKFEQYTFLKNKKAFVITLTTEADNFFLYKDKADKILNSFTLK